MGSLLGIICGPIPVSFWAPFGIHFGDLLRACPPPPIRSRNRLTFFHNNYYFNSILAPAAGLKEWRPESIGFWNFNSFRSINFMTTIPDPAGALESETRLKYCNSVYSAPVWGVFFPVGIFFLSEYIFLSTGKSLSHAIRLY